MSTALLALLRLRQRTKFYLFTASLRTSTAKTKTIIVDGVRKLIYRGYYKAAGRYEISLRVLKNFSTREEKFRISKRPCNVLFII